MIVERLIAIAPMAAVLVAILERMQDRDALVAQDSAVAARDSVAEPEAKTEEVRS